MFPRFDFSLTFETPWGSGLIYGKIPKFWGNGDRNGDIGRYRRKSVKNFLSQNWMKIGGVGCETMLIPNFVVSSVVEKQTFGARSRNQKIIIFSSFFLGQVEKKAAANKKEKRNGKKWETLSNHFWKEKGSNKKSEVNDCRIFGIHRIGADRKYRWETKVIRFLWKFTVILNRIRWFRFGQ